MSKPRMSRIHVTGEMGVGHHRYSRSEVHPMSYMLSGVGLLFVLFAVLGAIFS